MAAPRPTQTWEIQAPGIAGLSTFQSYRLDLPRDVEWDILRAYVVCTNTLQLTQANFNGSPGPPGAKGVIGYGAMYKNLFTKENEIASWSFFEQRKRFVEFQQPIRLSQGEFILVVSSAVGSIGFGSGPSGIVYGVEVASYGTT